MGSAAPKQPATYADLQALPDNKVGEILEGELFVSPRPALAHALATSATATELMGPFQFGRGGGPGGWWILFEPELHLGSDVLVPDIAGWRKERMPRLPDASAMTLAPDWLCEVLSPATEAIDRTRKLHIYAREQVNHIWLINPKTQTLEVFAYTRGGWTLSITASGKDKVRAAPFAEHE